MCCISAMLSDYKSIRSFWTLGGLEQHRDSITHQRAHIDRPNYHKSYLDSLRIGAESSASGPRLSSALLYHESALAFISPRLGTSGVSISTDRIRLCYHRFWSRWWHTCVSWIRQLRRCPLTRDESANLAAAGNSVFLLEAGGDAHEDNLVSIPSL
jgi:hypothetical protein